MLAYARPVPGTASARVEVAKGYTRVWPDVLVVSVGAGLSAVTAAVTSVRPRRGAIITARAGRGVEALGGAARVRLSHDFCGFFRFLTYFDRSAF
jgi:hypothetical protein